MSGELSEHLRSQSRPNAFATQRRQPRVLVVEPDPAVQQLCQCALEEIGVAVTVTRRANEARALIATEMVDLAYIALVPGAEREGETFAEYATDHRVHVVLMSGHSEGIERGLAAGYPFVRKPFHLRDVFRPLIRNLAYEHMDRP